MNDGNTPHGGLLPADQLRKWESQPQNALIKPAKLCVDDREVPCIILNASAEVVRAKIFVEIPPHRKLCLELASGDRVEVVLVWQTADQAGFFLVESSDARKITAGPAKTKARGLRMRVSGDVLLHTRSRPVAAEVVDLSQQGAGIICSSSLVQGEIVKFEAAGIGSIGARVRWSNHPRYGLLFDQVFTLANLASFCLGMQQNRRSLG
jgi:hypothetical protein